MSSTFFLLSAETSPLLCITLSTVPVETPANSAMSLILYFLAILFTVLLLRKGSIKNSSVQIHGTIFMIVLMYYVDYMNGKYAVKHLA